MKLLIKLKQLLKEMGICALILVAVFLDTQYIICQHNYGLVFLYGQDNSNSAYI